MPIKESCELVGSFMGSMPSCTADDKTMQEVRKLLVLLTLDFWDDVYEYWLEREEFKMGSQATYYFYDIVFKTISLNSNFPKTVLEYLKSKNII